MRRGVAGIGGLALLAACFVDPGPPSAADTEATSTGDGTTSAGSTTIMPPTTSSASEGSSSGAGCGDGCGAGETCVDGVCTSMTCAPETIARTYTAPAVVFSVDKSRSMTLNTWDHDGDPNTDAVTRWTTIRSVLVAAAANWEPEVDFGLKLFPDLGVPSSYTIEACALSPTLDVAVGPQTTEALNTILPSTDAEIAGGTPAKAGIDVAVAHLAAIAESDPRRPRFVIVVIDGAANCRADAADEFELFETYDAGVIGAAAAGLASGSPVAVVGVDISAELTPVTNDGQPDEVNVSALLDELALAGGLARSGAERYYNTHDEAGVKVALAELLTGMVCTVVVDPPHAASILTGLQAAGQPAPALDPTACSIENGWYDAGGGRLRLCGALCELYRAGGELTLDFVCGA